jgi:AcrR family transcriptional regulator
MTDRPDDRRTQIVAAALRLVARDGAALVTTRKIAREAHVNLATIHYVFGSKDILLLEVLVEVTGLMIAALGKPVPASLGLRAVLAGAWQALLALVDREPQLPLVRCELQLYLHRHPELAQAARAQRRRYLAALVSLHDGICAEEESDDCKIIAELMASVVDGLAIQRAGLDSGETLQQTCDHALRAVPMLAEEHTSLRVPAAS